MRATFEGQQQRQLNHALSCLSRFGETVGMQCIPEGQKGYVIRMSTVAPSQSAFCAFMLAPSFFRTYSTEPGKMRYDLQFPVKNMQAIFRNQLNKRMSSCEWQIFESKNECRLAVRMHTAQGTTKTYKLTYEAVYCMFPRELALSRNIIIASPMTIQALLDFFTIKPNGEVTLTCTPHGCSLRSCGEALSEERHQKSLHTEVKVARSSFTRYEINHPTSIVIGLREFRAPVSLADHMQLQLHICFTGPGDPMVITIDMPDMTAQVFIATSNPDVPVSMAEPPRAAPVKASSGSAPAQQPLQRISTSSEQDVVHSGRSAPPGQPLESTRADARRTTTQSPDITAADHENDQDAPNDESQGIPPSIPNPTFPDRLYTGRIALPGQPIASTLMAAGTNLRAVEHERETEFAQVEGDLFRGLEDEPMSQDHPASRAIQASTLAPNDRGASRMASIRRGEDDGSTDSSLWRSAGAPSLTYDEELEAERRAGIDKADFGSDTEDEEDSGLDKVEEDLPGTQTAESAKRKKYNPLF